MNDFILVQTGASLIDITKSMDSYTTGTSAIGLDVDKFLYLGSDFPFNSKFFKLSVINAVAATVIYEYWNGESWTQFVHKQDETITGSAPFAKSGEVVLIPSKDRSWAYEDTTTIPELSTVTIYDKYWIRIRSSTAIAVTFNWIGRIFANDNDVKAEFPDLGRTEFFTAYQSGKTSWEEQLAVASQLVIEDLIAKNIISSGNQLLDTKKLKSATVSRLAMLVYSALGDDHLDQLAKAANEYKNRLHNGLFNVDLTNDAILQKAESKYRSGRLSR